MLAFLVMASEPLKPLPKPHQEHCRPLGAISCPFNSNSPTSSTFTAFSTAISTRGLMSICPGFASSQSREATLEDRCRWRRSRSAPRNRWCRGWRNRARYRCRSQYRVRADATFRSTLRWPCAFQAPLRQLEARDYRRGQDRCHLQWETGPGSAPSNC